MRHLQKNTLALVLALCVLTPALYSRCTGPRYYPPALPSADPAELWTYITDKQNPYTEWPIFPGIDRQSTAPWFHASEEPHGAWVRVHISEASQHSFARATENPVLMKYTSILVKENYPPGPTFYDPPADSSLLSVTVMYKVEGFNPDDNDWFWVMYTPAGEVQTVGNQGWFKADPQRWEKYKGQVLSGSPTFCTDCHNSAKSPTEKSYGDYVWRLLPFDCPNPVIEGCKP